MAPATSTTPAVEVWKDIEGFEGFYQVSTKGRVRSLDRYIDMMTRHGTMCKRLHKGMMRKLMMSTNGYLSVMLTKGSKGTMRTVHRLVAETFLPNPDNLSEVNHKDENRTNNKVENLEWCDRIYNINYGTVKQRIAKSRSRKVKQLNDKGEVIAIYDSAKDAAKAVNGRADSIGKACRFHPEFKHHKGYVWRYADKRGKHNKVPTTAKALSGQKI